MQYKFPIIFVKEILIPIALIELTEKLLTNPNTVFLAKLVLIVTIPLPIMKNESWKCLNPKINTDIDMPNIPTIMYNLSQ